MQEDICHCIEKRTFKRHLEDWFNKNQHELPWETAESILYLSEVMLRQTQIKKTVIDYYALYNAFQQLKIRVMRMRRSFKNIGRRLSYYSRARNFHSAIKEVHQV